MASAAALSSLLAASLPRSLATMTHAQACAAFGLSGALFFPLLFFVPAPYGKLYRAGQWRWPAMGGRTGWFVQEIISPITLLFAFYAATLASSPSASPLPLAPAPVHVFLLLWCLHYANRAVLYPLQRHMSPTTVPVVFAAILFNLVNGGLVGHELALAAKSSFADWQALRAPSVVCGLALMAAGAALNIRSDATLRALRAKPGDKGYHIPRGGLFELVTCPHYLGEIVEWCGFALATGTLSGAVFAGWTFANLAPRAASTRAWYRAKFKEDFPARRKALVPFIF
jgi:3-oxo-5-alpha-steroid 4-dehydrogenase 1